MPLTGFDVNTIGSIVNSQAVLSCTIPVTANGTTTLTPQLLGLTQGGSTFTPGDNVESVTADGLPGNVKGLQYRKPYTPSVSSTLIQFADADLVRMFGAGTASGGETTYPLHTPYTYLSDDQYLRNFEFITERDDGKYIGFRFPWAYMTVSSIKPTDKQMQASVKIDGLVALTGNPSTDLLVQPLIPFVRTTLFEASYT